jgi:uncharacterized protein with von Willebrand factor type A (vWA) domain
MCSLIHRKKLGAMPTHLQRALASVKAGAARLQGAPRSLSRSDLPQMVAPELEWDLLRAVEQAARHYRRAQQELAHREELGGGEEEFRKLLDAVTLCHYQLDRALLDIQRYYESTGSPLP